MKPETSHAIQPCFATGQDACYDAQGHSIPCTGQMQDAASRAGVPWPSPRFEPAGETFIDLLTGLAWWHDANPAEFPLSWSEAFEFIAQMNQTAWGGHADWRLPNRRELRSLIDYGHHRPALPPDLPARHVFQSWYWTSTTAAIHPDHAWYVDLAGGRMFYGGKDQRYMVWPVRGRSVTLPVTGQHRCFETGGKAMACAGTGQDGESRLGIAWPSPRFVTVAEGVIDSLTGLVWYRPGRLKNLENGRPGRLKNLENGVNWEAALNCIAELNATLPPEQAWRLPNINELESLVDSDRDQPALPDAHPFLDPGDVYWSSTTSVYEPDWAWALYLGKGALGVGHKPFARFAVWPVRGGQDAMNRVPLI